MKKSMFLMLGMLFTLTLLSQSKNEKLSFKGEIPMLIGSTKVAGYPIEITNLKGDNVVNKSNCPVLQYIASKKEQYKNWKVTNVNNKTSEVIDMRLERINNIYILLIQAKDYVVAIKSLSSEILKFNDKQLYFHNGDGKVIKIEKES